jgi:hypothetical protein
MSLDYSTQTSEFSYRFRSPHTPASSASDATSTTPPPISELTELFLPRRIYPSHATKYILSPGGRIYFDWPNQRAFIWFVDPDHSSDPRLAKLSKSARTRRVDIWVGTKKVEVWKWWQVLAILVAVLAVVAGVTALQLADWEKERRMGLKPWAGVSIWKAKWLD